MKRNSDWFLIALFSGGFMLGPISLDALMPALPTLARHFGVTNGDIQVSFGIYFAGFAAGQLINGPLADRFGRRPILIIGLTLFVLASYGSLIAQNLGVFLAIRFIQGLAGNAANTLGRTVARDLFEREQAARLMAYYFGFGAAGPIIGPALGGWMVETIGFQAIFLLMIGFGTLVLAAAAIGFYETIPARNPAAINPLIIGVQFRRFLHNQEFIAYTFCSTFSALGIFAFINASAPFMIETLGVTPANYGLLVSLIMCGFMAGGLISGRIVRQVGLDQMILIGGILVGSASSALLIAAIAGLVDIYIIVGTFIVYLFGHAMLSPQANAGALTPFPDAAGTAASLSGFVMTASGALLNVILGVTADGTAMPMAIATAVGGLGTLFSYLVLVRNVRRRLGK